MKSLQNSRSRSQGFTLAEVAIATGIAAGVLAILSMVMASLSRDVRRLIPYEAQRRPAFDGKAGAAGGNTGSTSTGEPDDDGKDTSSKPGTHVLPDDTLDPAKRPDETKVPPDPDDPDAGQPPDSPASGAGSTPSPTS